METSSLRTLKINAQKPQRNCTFMNSASVCDGLWGIWIGSVRVERIYSTCDSEARFLCAHNNPTMSIDKPANLYTVRREI